jgi:hypothetical protein
LAKMVRRAFAASIPKAVREPDNKRWYRARATLGRGSAIATKR